MNEVKRWNNKQKGNYLAYFQALHLGFKIDRKGLGSNLRLSSLKSEAYPLHRWAPSVFAIFDNLIQGVRILRDKLISLSGK